MENLVYIWVNKMESVIVGHYGTGNKYLQTLVPMMQEVHKLRELLHE